MPRWEANTPARLEQAAIELFAAQGYEETTVEQIAAAAGVTRSTLFRLFGDKRAILSGGQNGLASWLHDRIQRVPSGRTAIEAVDAALVDLESTWFPAERRTLASLRAAVVSSSSELQERELLKRVDITSEVENALRSRGIEEFTATVTAQLATLAFTRAVALWAAPGNTESFGAIATQTLQKVANTAAALR